jgi:2-keto-4-pentenoate hydratase/2-oxohepta-3-ene-1,7-dioic acid hydratase in catechol pathway
VKLGRGPDGLVAFDEQRGSWVALGADLGDDPLALLDEPGRSRVSEAIGSAPEAGPPAGLPFHPRSLRAFSLWEKHMVDAARVLARRFYPPAAGRITTAYERVTRRTFPKFKPPPKFYERPLFYMGNHTTFYGHGEELPWPRSTEYLDFELELGFVLGAQVRDATPEQGRAAIAGFVLVNDWSARDVQADDLRRGVFGPVVKSKTFANSMGAVIVSADELLPRWDRLRGRVSVNGELWCEGATAGARHDLGAMVAYASEDETLDRGDLFSTGTLPGCSGMELDRWLRPGDTVEMELEGVGTLNNGVGPRPPAS